MKAINLLMAVSLSNYCMFCTDCLQINSIALYTIVFRRGTVSHSWCMVRCFQSFEALYILIDGFSNVTELSV